MFEPPGVTPFTGVWIEILPAGTTCTVPRVTPFTGVWIEILRLHHRDRTDARHTLHGCVD